MAVPGLLCGPVRHRAVTLGAQQYSYDTGVTYLTPAVCRARAPIAPDVTRRDLRRGTERKAVPRNTPV